MMEVRLVVFVDKLFEALDDCLVIEFAPVLLHVLKRPRKQKHTSFILRIYKW